MTAALRCRGGSLGSTSMSTSVPDPLLAALNPEQRQAAAQTRGPVRILAGAGTGKTRTITHRIAAQIASRAFSPTQILAVTFTDRAAAEMRTRIAGLAPLAPVLADVSVRALTFHAAAWAQVRHFWPHLGAGQPLPDVLTSKIGLLIQAARRHGVDVADLAGAVEWVANAGLDAAEGMRDHDDPGGAVHPDRLATAIAAHAGPAGGDLLLQPDELAGVIAAYEAEKRRRGVIDYEDMLRLARRLLELPEPAATIRDRYRAFTVDEFQDTNPLQWQLLRAWVGPRDDVCVVGDPAQTIFSFTGADASILRQRFAATYTDTTTVSLTRSYRSTPQVLTLANAVLGRRATPLRAVDPQAEGPRPTLVEVADEAAEHDMVVQAVRTLLDGGVPASEIAICYRINAQAAPWEDALRAAAIPCTVAGEGSFYDRDDVRQALRVIAQAALTPPAPPAGDVPPVVDTPVVNADPAELIDRVFRDGLSWRGDRPPQGRQARERWEHHQAVRDEAAEMARAGMDLPAIDAELRRRASAGLAGGVHAVTLMSLHKAKGTEFDAVFLVGLEEGLMPISHASDDDDVDEERRLLYVGATRARRYLWLTWAASRPGRSGKPARRRPSRFLYGLGPGAPQPRAARRGGARPPAPVPDDVDAELAERLRAWRRQRSSSDGVPAFVVFNDATLMELAARRPSSRQGLLAVRGFGPAKADRYGQEVLELIGGR